MTQSIYAVAKLGIADLLAAGPRISEELASLAAVDPPACTGSSERSRASAVPLFHRLDVDEGQHVLAGQQRDRSMTGSPVPAFELFCGW